MELLIIGIAVALLGLACLAALLGHAIALHRPPHTPADVALVFGCGQPWKALARCRHALSLYQRGMVRHLIVSGGVPMHDDARLEADWFADWLIAHGVPAAAISRENRATNTHENVAYAWPVIAARGAQSVVLVMSDFEAIRAHLTARRAWWGQPIRIYDDHAPSPGHWHPYTWWLSREGWRLTCYTVPRLFRYRLLPYLWRRPPA
jgi:uncharacterized SAM-binding protein YcdF (DUF218 family)